ncbi:dTDP-4-dehydrorhamnose 3,5-epimerase [Allomuricauda sp. SCSIO 65647]|uniref:dTDP-4-dehydrorhamnose 3,5-epimerase n=1 Tax=Allomuricauda sp. SCSIO 65647 TaxID=2908843 RepID=UPI001F32E68F|nr:dTDP-4-dehydrorhamnose 3,5-epimerase [Muricauda sp. SCSIO 65647]UJH69271.1 dTDP-4-dehydrorhamnose 3,5-epimerase [Muricauda sp. SCSIO 65647]
MKLTETKLKGCFIFEHDLYKDERGTFQEAYNRKDFERLTGLKVDFVQDNISTSKNGVLRGLHFQKEPHGQAKLIKVLRGEVLDVIVDLRKDSKTFGEHLKLKIKASEGKSIFIPKGMAHGFLCLSEETVFQYKCDAFYNPNSESGIVYNDPDLAIDWGHPSAELILSEKDRHLPVLKALQL